MVGFRRRIPDNPTLRRFGGGLLPATFGETLGAAFDDPLARPTGLAGTQVEIHRERGEQRGNFPGPAGLSVTDPDAPDEEDLSPLVDAETLNRRYGDLGLTFDQPEREEVARILADQKRGEAIRRDVLARGPGGATAAAAQLGATFVSAAMDPLNVASAFVPIVSQARFAGLAARVGMTRARLAVGAIEGTAGAALVEPITFGLSREQQLDYTMADALVNVGFGAFLGGGLHAVGGKVGDFMRARRPETREATLRAAISQAVQGQTIDIEPVLRMPDAGIPSRRQRDLRGGTAAPALNFGFDAARAARGLPIDALDPADRVSALPAAAAREPTTIVPSVTRKGEPRVFDTEESATRAAERLRGEGTVVTQTADGRFAVGRERPDVEVERLPGGEVRRFRNERAAQRFIRDVRGDDPDLSVVPLGVREFAVARGLSERDLKDIAAAPQAARFADSPRQNEVVEAIDPDVRPEDALADIRRSVEAAFIPERDMTADFEAAREVDRALARSANDIDATQAQTEADFWGQAVDDLRTQGLVSDADVKTLGEVDTMIEHANQFARGARQAAVCMTRNA